MAKQIPKETNVNNYIPALKYGYKIPLKDIDTSGAADGNVMTYVSADREVEFMPAPGVGGSGSAYNLNNALGYAMLSGSTLTLTSFSAPSIIATGNIGETTKAGVAGRFGSGSDTTNAAPYTAALADAATIYTTLKGLSGIAITTPSALESNNLSGLGTGVFGPGVYTTASAIDMTASESITLSGIGDYVFVSTGGAITFGATDTMVLTNGASADRIFWVANNAITTGSTDILYGNFMSGVAGAITIGSTNIIQGRLLSPVAITADGTATAFSLPVGGSGTSQTLALASGNTFVGSLAGVATVTPISHVVKYSGKITWSGSGASLATTIAGVLATDIVVASIQTAPTQAGYLVSAAPTTDTITLVLSAANTGNQAIISYEVLRAV